MSVYTYSPAAERRRLPCPATLLYFQPGKSRGCYLAWSQSGPSFRRLEKRLPYLPLGSGGSDTPSLCNPEQLPELRVEEAGRLPAEDLFMG